MELLYIVKAQNGHVMQDPYNVLRCNGARSELVHWGKIYSLLYGVQNSIATNTPHNYINAKYITGIQTTIGGRC